MLADKILRRGETGEIEYLILHEDGPKAIKQLKGSDDMTLHQQRRGHSGDGPPARANGHFIEPLFQRKLTHRTTAGAPAEKIVHIHGAKIDRPER